jgi:hypothetical protein
MPATKQSRSTKGRWGSRRPKVNGGGAAEPAFAQDAGEQPSGTHVTACESVRQRVPAQRCHLSRW